jgi:hypothetical protein
MSFASELLIIVSAVWMTIKVISLLFSVSMGDATVGLISAGGVAGFINVFVIANRNANRGPYVYGKVY